MYSLYKILPKENTAPSPPQIKMHSCPRGGGLQRTPKINPHIFIYRPHLHPLHPLATLMNSNESAL